MRPSHHVPSFLGPLLAAGLLVLLAIAVAALVWWLVSRRRAKAHPGPGNPPRWQPGPAPHPGPPPAPRPPANAVQILDERLARGDIDVDDYLTRRAALLGDRPPNGAEFHHGPAGSPPDPSDAPT